MEQLIDYKRTKNWSSNTSSNKTGLYPKLQTVGGLPTDPIVTVLENKQTTSSEILKDFVSLLMLVGSILGTGMLMAIHLDPK